MKIKVVNFVLCFDKLSMTKLLLKKNLWNGMTTIQLNVKDLKI